MRVQSKLLKFYLAGFFVGAFFSSANAQYSDSPEITTFRTAIGDKSPIYFGRHYRGYTKYHSNSHAFFESEDWQDALLDYNGNTYSTKLRYEIVSDIVLIPAYYNKNISIEVNPELVRAFSFNNQHFVRLGENLPSFMRTGFYKVIFDGKVVFYSARKKEIKEIIEGMTVKYAYVESVNYFMKKDNEYVKVSSLGKLLKMFPDKKKEIKLQLRKNNISFNKSTEQALSIIGASINN